MTKCSRKQFCRLIAICCSFCNFTKTLNEFITTTRQLCTDRTKLTSSLIKVISDILTILTKCIQEVIEGATAFLNSFICCNEQATPEIIGSYFISFLCCTIALSNLTATIYKLLSHLVSGISYVICCFLQRLNVRSSLSLCTREVNQVKQLTEPTAYLATCSTKRLSNTFERALKSTTILTYIRYLISDVKQVIKNIIKRGSTTGFQGSEPIPVCCCKISVHTSTFRSIIYYVTGKYLTSFICILESICCCICCLVGIYCGLNAKQLLHSLNVFSLLITLSNKGQQLLLYTLCKLRSACLSSHIQCLSERANQCIQITKTLGSFLKSISSSTLCSFLTDVIKRVKQLTYYRSNLVSTKVAFAQRIKRCTKIKCSISCRNGSISNSSIAICCCLQLTEHILTRHVLCSIKDAIYCTIHVCLKEFSSCQCIVLGDMRSSLKLAYKQCVSIHECKIFAAAKHCIHTLSDKAHNVSCGLIKCIEIKLLCPVIDNPKIEATYVCSIVARQSSVSYKASEPFKHSGQVICLIKLYNELIRVHIRTKGLLQESKVFNILLVTPVNELIEHLVAFVIRLRCRDADWIRRLEALRSSHTSSRDASTRSSFNIKECFSCIQQLLSDKSKAISHWSIYLTNDTVSCVNNSYISSLEIFNDTCSNVIIDLLHDYLCMILNAKYLERKINSARQVCRQRRHSILCCSKVVTNGIQPVTKLTSSFITLQRQLFNRLLVTCSQRIHIIPCHRQTSCNLCIYTACNVCNCSDITCGIIYQLRCSCKHFCSISKSTQCSTVLIRVGSHIAKQSSHLICNFSTISEAASCIAQLHHTLCIGSNCGIHICTVHTSIQCRYQSIYCATQLLAKRAT